MGHVCVRYVCVGNTCVAGMFRRMHVGRVGCACVGHVCMAGIYRRICVCWTWVWGGHVCGGDTHVHVRDVQDHTRVLNTHVCGRDMPGAHVCVWNTCVHGRDVLGAYVCRDACARHGRVWSTCLCASAIPGARGFPGKPMFIPRGSSASCFNPR